MENELNISLIKSDLEAKTLFLTEISQEKEEKFIKLKLLQKNLHEKQNIFECYTISLAKTLFLQEFLHKNENFLALQKVYGSKVLKMQKDLLYQNILEKIKNNFAVISKKSQKIGNFHIF